MHEQRTHTACEMEERSLPNGRGSPCPVSTRILIIERGTFVSIFISIRVRRICVSALPVRRFHVHSNGNNHFASRHYNNNMFIIYAAEQWLAHRNYRKIILVAHRGPTHTHTLVPEHAVVCFIYL